MFREHSGEHASVCIARFFAYLRVHVERRAREAIDVMRDLALSWEWTA
jgi:hypothetical protein